MSGGGWIQELVDALLGRAVYATAHRVVPAVPGGAGWYSLGEFVLPQSRAWRIAAVGSVSETGLIATVRLFDMTDMVALGSAATLDSKTPARAFSSVLQLTGGHRYQFQAQCAGALRDANFATIQTATIAD